MPLHLTVKPGERIIINGAVIRNNSDARSANLLVENHCRILRESEIIRESEADTPAKKLCVTLQVLHISDAPAEPLALLRAQAVELLATMPMAKPFIERIEQAILDGYTHPALKAGRDLVRYEAETARQPDQMHAQAE